jgi:holo-[acyl-carrier protein] synthase
MILGIGADICNSVRVERLLDRYGEVFPERIFTSLEQDQCNARSGRAQVLSYACRFAAKEAFVKALGTGMRHGIVWRDIETVAVELGRPILRLHGEALNQLQKRTPQSFIPHLHLSLSHDWPMAYALVVLEIRPAAP